MLAIDRRRFLALTAAMAAAHCAPPPPPVVSVPAEEMKIAPAGTSSASAEPLPAEESPKPPEAKESGDKEGVVLAPGDRSSAARSPVKGQSCPPADNMKGSPSLCTIKAPGPTCESFTDTKGQCDATRTWLKPRVAEKAVQCHLAKSGTPAICQFNLVTDCVTEALSSACIDPAAVTTCAKVMNKCVPGKYATITTDSCVAAVSAVNDAQKAKFVSCITEFCRFETCFYHLVPTAEATGKKPGPRPLFKRPGDPGY